MMNIDKRDRADLFRTRLLDQMAAAGLNRSDLARRTGVDRSTIAQLLSPQTTRLPNAHLAAECAATLGVSSDWLLGLSDRRERSGELIAAAVSITQAARATVDDQLLDWHREAAGYKIRHVPATLPDVLKTEAVLAWEYEHFLGKTPEQAIGAMQDRYVWLGEHLSDYEVALPMGEISTFAAGVGYYGGLSRQDRIAQLELLAERTAALYPSLRVFLFDAKRVFSAPVTVFGPLLAVVYVGRFYLAFRARDRVRSMAEHFDGLVREAEVDARAVSAWIEDKLREI